MCSRGHHCNQLQILQSTFWLLHCKFYCKLSCWHKYHLFCDQKQYWQHNRSTCSHADTTRTEVKRSAELSVVTGSCWGTQTGSSSAFAADISANWIGCTGV